MATDKQIYLILQRCPKFLHILGGYRSPGQSVFKSLEFKDLSRRADGIEFPLDPDQPLTVIEAQFGLVTKKGNVYRQIIAKMVMAQEEYPERDMRGVILFANRACDPDTQPWKKLVRVRYLDETLAKLEAKNPKNPLVCVFKPVMEQNDEKLVCQAPQHYRAIQRSKKLTATQRDTLTEVFENWLLQRFKDKTKQELAMILDLPDVRQTRCGRELLDEGREEGMAEMVIAVARKRLGKISKSVEERIRNLDAKLMEPLLIAVLEMKSVKELRDWLEAK